MSKKICNPKEKVPSGICLNDQDEMTILLTFLKNLEKNMAVSLTESSHEELYKDFQNIFDNISELQRKSYELMFKKGWYTLESADNTKINTTYNELSKQLQDLNN